MWAANDLWHALGAGANSPANGGVAPATLEQHVANAARAGQTTRQIPCCPLMHGTGLFTAIGTLVSGGCVITLAGNKFDALELFDTVQKHQAQLTRDRRRRVREADAERARREPGPLGPFLGEADRLVRGHVEHRGEEGAARAIHGGMLLTDSFGSSEARGLRRLGDVGRGRGAHREVHDRRPLQGVHARTTAK